MTDPVLAVRGLSAGYGVVPVLRNLGLDVHAGEAVTVIGANGAGKSTLLRTIAGLLTPTAGSIRFDGDECGRVAAEHMVRRGVSLVPEGRQVFAGLSVDDNLLLGAYVRRRRATHDRDVIYDLFPQLADRREQLAGTLSGGEQQMLAIGRSLMSRPRLLLLDEPSLGLAPIIVGQVIRQLLVLRERGTTILLVEQNARAAFQVATRGYVLRQGRIVLAGPVEQLADDPEVQRAYLLGS